MLSGITHMAYSLKRRVSGAGDVIGRPRSSLFFEMAGETTAKCLCGRFLRLSPSLLSFFAETVLERLALLSVVVSPITATEREVMIGRSRSRDRNWQSIGAPDGYMNPPKSAPSPYQVSTKVLNRSITGSGSGADMSLCPRSRESFMAPCSILFFIGL